MKRQCSCSGACGPQSDEVNRREFISIVGAGTTTAFLSGPAWADWLQKQAAPEELAGWKRALFEPAAPRLYRSDVHKDARMHLGGIGTGNFEIGVDGQFTTWQLFNTLHDGQVPLMFAVRAGDTVRLLQTAGGPDWPRIRQIEMTGEYPIATLRYVDPELPVHVELSAFTPFAPLDSRFSSQPLAVLTFRVQNPTAQPQTVSLAALMQNPVGYDAVVVKGAKHE
jgi:non-lysosomal glucosylceramidase